MPGSTLKPPMLMTLDRYSTPTDWYSFNTWPIFHWYLVNIDPSTLDQIFTNYWPTISWHIEWYFNNSSIWLKNMLGYLSMGTIYVPSGKQFSIGVSLRKTVSFEEQIMSKEKYPSIFSCQMGSIGLLCLLSFNYFSQQAQFWKLEN